VEAIGVLAVITVRSVFTPKIIWHEELGIAFFVVLGYTEFLRRHGRELLNEASLKAYNGYHSSPPPETGEVLPSIKTQSASI
jgi:hypothetical protein